MIADPTEKSLGVARRAVQMAKERDIGKIAVLTNRIREGQYLQPFQQLFENETISPIPFDMEIEAADRAGRAPIDHSPGSPAVTAFTTLAELLLPAKL